MGMARYCYGTWPSGQEVASGQQIAVLDHPDWVLSVSFSPDGTTLASGSFDGAVRLWDVASGQQIAALEGHTGRVLSRRP